MRLVIKISKSPYSSDARYIAESTIKSPKKADSKKVPFYATFIKKKFKKKKK